ncbi:MAG: hypothetical protein ABWK01_07890 [Infirmifilum sp.]
MNPIVNVRRISHAAGEPANAVEYVLDYGPVKVYFYLVGDPFLAFKLKHMFIREYSLGERGVLIIEKR